MVLAIVDEAAVALVASDAGCIGAVVGHRAIVLAVDDAAAHVGHGGDTGGITAPVAQHVGLVHAVLEGAPQLTCKA